MAQEKFEPIAEIKTENDKRKKTMLFKCIYG